MSATELIERLVKEGQVSKEIDWRKALVVARPCSAMISLCVLAGRLRADDELHVLAVSAINGIFPAPEKAKSRGLLGALRSWLGL